MCQKLVLGAHVSISGGIETAPVTGRKLGLDAIQIFTKNQRQWIGKPLRADIIDKFKENVKKYRMIVVAHDSYLINLATKDDRAWYRAKASFLDEIRRCEQLEIPYLIFHPGSHKGAGETYALKRIITALNEVLKQSEHVTLLLETTAGQGTSVGYKFEHLARIIEEIDNNKRVGVCIDTCHIYAAGYDIVYNYHNVMTKFDKIVGLEKLKVIHLNDSEKPLGSRVDRHAHIGKGTIGVKGFKNILCDSRLRTIPMILETPQVEAEYYIDLAVIHNILKRQA